MEEVLVKGGLTFVTGVVLLMVKNIFSRNKDIDECKVGIVKIEEKRQSDSKDLTAEIAKLTTSTTLLSAKIDSSMEIHALESKNIDEKIDEIKKRLGKMGGRSEGK